MIKAGRSSIIHETLEKSFLDGPRFKFSFWDRSERFYGIPFFLIIRSTGFYGMDISCCGFFSNDFYRDKIFVLRYEIS